MSMLFPKGPKDVDQTPRFGGGCVPSSNPFLDICNAFCTSRTSSNVGCNRRIDVGMQLAAYAEAGNTTASKAVRMHWRQVTKQNQVGSEEQMRAHSSLL